MSIRLPFEAATSQFIADDPKLINFRYFFTRKLDVRQGVRRRSCSSPAASAPSTRRSSCSRCVQTGKAQPAPIVLLDVPGGTYWQTLAGVRRGELRGPRLHLRRTTSASSSVTDDVDVAVDEVTGFYANYHSLRFVDGRLVLRMQPRAGRRAARARSTRSSPTSSSAARSSAIEATRGRGRRRRPRRPRRGSRSGSTGASWARLRDADRPPQRTSRAP